MGRAASRRNEEEAEEELVKKRWQEVAITLAQRGLMGKALQRLTGPGVAPDTQEFEDVMRSKFVAAPPTQAASRRPPAPPTNELNPDIVVKAVDGGQQG